MHILLASSYVSLTKTCELRENVTSDWFYLSTTLNSGLISVISVTSKPLTLLLIFWTGKVKEVLWKRKENKICGIEQVLPHLVNFSDCREPWEMRAQNIFTAGWRKSWEIRGHTSENWKKFVFYHSKKVCFTWYESVIYRSQAFAASIREANRVCGFPRRVSRKRTTGY